MSDALQWSEEGISDIFDISHVVLSQASSLAKNLLYTSALAKANECGQSQKSVSELKMGETTEYYSWIKSSTGHLSRAGNSVYLGSGAANQKKAQEPKTQEEGKKEEMGREKNKRRGVGREKKKRRGVRGEEIGKKDQTNIRTQKKQGGI